MEKEPRFSTPEDKESKQETQDRTYNLLSEKLKERNDVITDEELIELTRESARESGLEEDIFEDSESRPKVFYRSFRDTEEVRKMLEQDEVIQRPFSYSLPGTTGDLPLSYGGKNPVLIRIIDTSGEWEDTGPSWGFSGSWNEAMNLDPVVLRKIDERVLGANDLYKQVEADVIVDDVKITQATLMVDKFRTIEIQASNSLEAFVNDMGFWKEIGARAINFTIFRGNEHMMRECNKYLEYFDQTMRLDSDSAESEDVRVELEKTKIKIIKFIKRVVDVRDGNPNWTLEEAGSVLRSFSLEAWQGYFKSLIRAQLGENPSDDDKERIFEERTLRIEEKTGNKFRREDFKL